MVNNSTNIIKTKESLSSHGQQLNQHHQMKEILNSHHSQQFNQYQQNERMFK